MNATSQIIKLCLHLHLSFLNLFLAIKDNTSVHSDL